MAWGSLFSPDFRAQSIVGAAAGTTALNDRRLVEGVAGGTPSFVVDAIDTGRYCLQLDSSGGGSELTLSTLAASGARYAGGLCRFRIVSNSGTPTLMGFNAVTSAFVRVGLTSGNVLRYSWDNGSTWTNTSTTLTTGQVYRLECFVDYGTSTTHTLWIYIDGAVVANGVTGGTGTDQSNGLVVIGQHTLTAAVIQYSDHAAYNDPAQQNALASWRVLGLEPTVDGTHSMTASDFQDDASTNLSNASTGTFAKVNDAPAAAPNVTAFVKQVVLRTTSYMEWQLRAMPSGYADPLKVDLAGAFHPVAAATANLSQMRLVSGANVSTEATIDASVASNTIEYRRHNYQTEPVSAAAWTTAMVQAPLRVRFGFSGDVAPPPACDALMAFVLVPFAPFPVSRPALQAVNQASTY